MNKGWDFRRVTPAQAAQIADAYFICEQDRRKMAEFLGLPRVLDMEFLAHPFTRRAIAEAVRQMRRDNVYTREEHVRKLKEIRDHALGDENWKVGLSAEIAVGKAAGLYENIRGDGDEQDQLGSPGKPVDQLSTDELKRRLDKMQNGQPSLPAPAPNPKYESNRVPARDAEAF